LAAERKAVELHQTNHAARVADLEAFLHQSRHRQSKLSTTQKKLAESSSSKPGAAQMLQLHLDQQHHQPDPSRWPAIFRKKSQGLQKAMAEEKATIAALERILAGYETYLPPPLSSPPTTPEPEQQP
jgi:hypothetical protein